MTTHSFSLIPFSPLTPTPPSPPPTQHLEIRTPQSHKSVEAQIAAIAAQVAAKQLEVKRCTAAATSAAADAAEAHKRAEETHIKASAAMEDLRLLTAAFKPLQLSLGLPTLDTKWEAPQLGTSGTVMIAKPSKQVILVTSNDLGDLLETIALSDTSIPVIYDFQGREMKYKDKSNASLSINSMTWRNGKIMLPAETQLSLDVACTGMVLESISVSGGGGVRVLDGGSLTMTACEVQGSSNMGLHLEGTGTLVANDVNVMKCIKKGIYLEGSGSLVATNVNVSDSEGSGVALVGTCSMQASNLKVTKTEYGIFLSGSSTAVLTGCDVGDTKYYGICMMGSSSMVGTRVRITGAGADVLNMAGEAKLALTGCSMRNNPGKPGVIKEKASLVLTRCLVEGTVTKEGSATLVINS